MRLGVEKERVLVTGATGLLGRQVLRTFEERGWSTRGLGLARASVEPHQRVVRCDLLNPDEFRCQFETFRPSVVIHCAAERRPDVLEEDSAYATKINVELTREIGRICRQTGAWLIYMSTNYVFDGKNAPYDETATPNPVNTYGTSKLAGERVLAECCPDAAIVRVPLLYGPIEYSGETSVTALLSTVQKCSSKLDNWQERFPTRTVDVARVVEAFTGAYVARDRTSEDFRGVFHWQANERHTKYTMAVFIAEIAGLDPSDLVRVDAAPAAGSAPRPQFERMSCGRMEKLLEAAGEGKPEDFRADFRTSLAQDLALFLPQRRSFPPDWVLDRDSRL